MPEIRFIYLFTLIKKDFLSIDKSDVKYNDLYGRRLVLALQRLR